MSSQGFRPKGEYKQVSVVEFVKTKFGDKIFFACKWKLSGK